MNLDHLRYFKTIAECEHYGRAAEILHVSQPNLNYAVTQLESELGVELDMDQVMKAHELYQQHGLGARDDAM